jgi:shikimate dehydrogenase
MTRTAAVIGHPISHSLSPAIFGFLSDALNFQSLRYFALDVLPEKLGEFMSAQKLNSEAVGFNVTIPHKERIFDFVDEVASEAQTIGAINVVALNGGRFKGYNTDILGLKESFNQNSIELKGQTVIILGAGGAARAAAYAAGLSQARRIIICGRQIARAESVILQLSSKFSNVEFLAVDEKYNFKNEKARLLIQATPLGMSSHATNESDFKLFDSVLQGAAESGAFAFDLVYRPEQTEFLIRAEKKGIKTVTGLAMLIGQALATWEIWFGPLANRVQLSQDLTKFLRSELAKKRIYLCGFMGAGKSTTGLKLAEKLSLPFYDTDQMIVEATGQSVADTFQQFGEKKFREFESEAIRKVSLQPPGIIALGGGALLNPENLKLIKQSGTLVYLKAEISTLKKRLAEAGAVRPLLTNLNEDQLVEMLQNREALYKSSHLTLQTDEKTPEAVSENLQQELRKLKI